ncbi:MAG TPA: sodium-dependent transporter [Sneathiellales bacterium]|nr:sodium-dependent transporter [Sneathiellales bacterium]
MQRGSHHEAWSSRFAFLLAAVGSAVGLGNIWKFPYVTGVNGGGAFVLVYVACVILVVIPILIGELLIGRRGGESPANSMAALAKDENRHSSWEILGWLGIIAAFLILTFYSVIAGWALAYVLETAKGSFENIDATGSREIFDGLLADPLSLGLWHGLFMGITMFVVSRGVKKGLERAVTVMLPSLFVILLVLVGYAAIAGEFKRAFDFLFTTDFSKIDANVILIAVGQAFFSVSVGIGALMTYGAYLPRDVSIPKMSCVIAAADTLVAVLAGLAIFPIVFAYGLEPGEGPGLIFVTLPIAFGQMPGGTFIGTLFFVLLAFAALTSSISLLEPTVSRLVEQRDWKRVPVTICAGVAAWLVGLGSVFSFNNWADFTPLGIFPTFANKTVFDLLDYLATNILLPLGGMLIAIFAGWLMAKKSTLDELGLTDGPVYRVWRFLVRFVSPVAVGLVFLFNLA